MFTPNFWNYQLPCLCLKWSTLNWGRKTNSRTKLVPQEKTGLSFLSSQTPAKPVYVGIFPHFLFHCCCWKNYTIYFDHAFSLPQLKPLLTSVCCVWDLILSLVVTEIFPPLLRSLTGRENEPNEDLYMVNVICKYISSMMGF